jgi:polysaccharide pyruvyl transferase WcaK-like protein
MRILVDTGAYDCANLGDVAMMQVTASRLRAFWPAASIEVITNNPEALGRFCPDAKPVPAKGRNWWFNDRNLLGHYHKYLPQSVSRQLDDLKRMMRRSFPSVLAHVLKLKLNLVGNNTEDFKAFREAFLGADVVVACGMGGLTDHCSVGSLALLEFLEAASRRGVPTAMFSQGVGPMTDTELRSMASEVLPRMDILAIRETRAAVPLLKSLGLNHHRLLATGDDAIEMAYEARSSEMGEGLGVNLRVARSACVEAKFIELLRPIIFAAAEFHKAPLIPLPIGNGRASQDRNTLTQLLSGLVHSSMDADTPNSVIRRVGKCRVVLTGAYHAAVFALAQGIPVVCLAKSPYFIDKFLGLANQFGPGCEVIRLDSPELKYQIISGIDRLWLSAEDLRPRLQEAALRQIEASRNAYKRFADIVAERCQLVPAPAVEPKSTCEVRPAY